jgi:hypothetical protein
MSGQSLDAEASETVAGVVRLLRRAAELVWVAIDTDTAGSHRQLLALGIDLAADEARNLLPDAIPIDGPAPVGAEPAGLLRSAERLLQRVATGEAATGLDGLLAGVANLVWEANSGVLESAGGVGGRTMGGVAFPAG